jgi:hypothetical protein
MYYCTCNYCTTRYARTATLMHAFPENAVQGYSNANA